MELFGSHYVIEHCIVALNHQRREKAFRSYVADGIKNINEILAKAYGGTYLSIGYLEMIGDRAQKAMPEDGDAIVRDVFNRAGLKAKGGEGNGDTI